MKNLLAGIGMMMLVSCAGQEVYVPACRHNALISAVIVSEQYQEVRIDFGPTDGGVWHAQAKAFISGEWVWLQVANGRVYLGRKERFDALNSYTVKEYMDLMGWGK